MSGEDRALALPRATPPSADRALSAPAIARGAFVNLLGNLAGLLDPLLLVVVSRALGPKSLGVYVLATTYVSVMMRLAVLGLDRGLLRHVPLARHEPDPAAAQLAVLGTAMRWTLGLSLLVSAAVCLLADTLANSREHSDLHLGRWLALLALSLPLQALATFCLCALRALHDMLAFVVIRNALGPLLVLVLSWLGVVAGMGESALVIGYLVAHSITAVCALVWFRRGFPEVSVAAMASAPRDRALLVFSFPQGLTELVNLLLARADMLMIAFFFPDKPELIASYTIASLVAGSVKKVRQSFDNSLSPALATLIARGDRIALATTYAQITRLIYALFLALSGVLAFGAPLILWAFGQQFADAWLLVPILLAGRLANAASGPAQAALLMAGHSRIELTNSALGLILNVAASAALIPAFGAYGAALASALTLIAFNGLRLWQARRLVGVTPPWSALRALSLAALGAAAPGVLLTSLWPAAIWAHALAVISWALLLPAALGSCGMGGELLGLLRALARSHPTEPVRRTT
jgi:O-antigen/teichoic acid export membrane protein